MKTAAPRYRVVDLCADIDADDAVCVDVNDKSQCAIIARRRGQARSYLWDDGKRTDLGTADGRQCLASALNDRGQIVGSLMGGDHDDQRAFLWEKGRITALPSLGGATTYALDINNRGQIVGTGSHRNFQGLRWEQGRVSEIARSLDARMTFDPAINNQGTIAGTCSSERDHVFVVEGDRNPRLLPLDHVTCAGINDRGDIVGDYRDRDRKDAGVFLYRSGKSRIIRAPRGVSWHSRGVNDSGWIVGDIDPFGRSRGFLCTDGDVQDLNRLVTDTGWRILSARAINRRGCIAATGQRGGRATAVLLVSSRPAPATA